MIVVWVKLDSLLFTAFSVYHVCLFAEQRLPPTHKDKVQLTLPLSAKWEGLGGGGAT